MRCTNWHGWPKVTSPAIDNLRQLIHQAWTPVEAQPPVLWCAEHVRLDPDEEAGATRYDPSERPWWAGVLEAAASPLTRTITIPASTQVGKTITLIALLIYLARNAPARGLVVLPDRDAAVEFRDRCYADADASGLSIPPPSRRNLRHMDLGAMRVYLAWSGSKQRVRSRRCKYVFLSEVDVYQFLGQRGDPVVSASQRVKSFPRHLIYSESSPVPETSRIDELYQGTDRRHWWARCPVCGLWQTIQFFPGEDGRGGVVGLKDEQGEWLEPEAARVAAHYVCRAGCVISSARKSEFIRAGQWVPRGCTVDAAGRLQGTPERGGRDVGFRLWAALSPESWGGIAAEYLIARRDGTLPDFSQNWLGTCYRTKSSMPGWEELGRRLSVPSYTRGQVPADVWFLTGSADVQADEIYYVVRGWGDQATSWLIDWFVFAREAGDAAELVKSDFAQLTAARELTFPVMGMNPRGRQSLSVALLGCDAKYRTPDVHQWLLSLNKPATVRALQGSAQLLAHERYRRSVVKESRRERDDGSGPVVYEGGLELWSVNSQVYRLDVAGRFNGAADQPGAWLLPNDVKETGRFYLRQLVNEPPTYERGKDGRARLVFRERDKNLGHDFWDCEVNGRVLAQMVVDQLPGAPGWDARKWDRGERPAVTRRVAPKADRSAR